jgi:hypothetical protein
MATKFSGVPQYYYDRQKIARKALAEASIPIEKATAVLKHLQNPHKHDETAVYRRAQSQLLFSKHILDQEHKSISEVHQKLEEMMAGRPPYCATSSKGKINGPSHDDWKEISPDEKTALLRATVKRAGAPSAKEPSTGESSAGESREVRPRIIFRNPAYKRELLCRRQEPICAILEKHAKSCGCPTEHSKDRSKRMGAKYCAARARMVIEAEARNDKLLREVEAMESEVASRGIDTSALSIKPLNIVRIDKLERDELEKVYGIKWAREFAEGSQIE